MIKTFFISSAAIAVSVFSSSVIAHSLAIPHVHDNTGLLASHYWLLGIIASAVLVLATIGALRRIK